MKKKIGLSALLVCFLLVLTLLVSVLSVSHSIGHVCADGTCCRICAVVQGLLDTFKDIALAAAFASFAFGCLYSFTKHLLHTEFEESQLTPVLLKVKLSN